MSDVTTTPVEGTTGPAESAGAPEVVATALSGFQEAASFAGVPDDVCQKLPVAWPADRVGVGRALKVAGYTGDLTTTMRAIEEWRATSPAPTASTVSPSADPKAEIPEGTQPSRGQINAFATGVGMDPNMLWTFLLLGKLGDTDDAAGMDISSAFPVANILPGYSPKRRDMPYIIMGMIERRLKADGKIGDDDGIIAINQDGSVNIPITVAYIKTLDDNFEPAENNIYYDEAGKPYQLIKVGVDAQSVYDADPVDSSRPVGQNGLGVGRIRWTGVSLEVRQAIWYAAHQTAELSPEDETRMSWLRANIKPDTTLLDLNAEFPKAVMAYHADFRVGKLPSLRVQPTRQARRKTLGPNRRATTPRDLTAEVPPALGGGFRRSERESAG